MDPLLLSSACSGSWQDLELLLNDGSGQLHPSARHNQQGSEDVEASPKRLLEGVATGGRTALHMVATHGDSDGFLRSAGIIHSKAKHLLFARDDNGDTPLHCASRARMSRMVSRLIGLAGAEDHGGRVKELLEMENQAQETALHQAVRVRSGEIVRLLMEEDPELAGFPRHGASPLYLAVLLEEDAIAETLYSASRQSFPTLGRMDRTRCTLRFSEAQKTTETPSSVLRDSSSSHRSDGSG